MKAMRGLKVGHFTGLEEGTGVSVFLFDQLAVGAYRVCGAAPATHELIVMDSDNSVGTVNGLVLTGGSAYGLYAAKGVMRYLTEKGQGYPTPHGIVPIVPVAAIYDLAYKKAQPPDENEAYRACLAAKENNHESGRIGAGTGATIGRIIPGAKPMTGGLGYAELALKNGVKVLAYAVVNCVGDVRDETGKIIAGACNQQDQFIGCNNYLLSGFAEEALFHPANSTLVAVFTNAKFSKDELSRIVKMGIAGFARAISPIFTRYDGDILFCISIGERIASELTVGTMAAEAVRLAIVNAVKDSEIL